MEIIFQLGCLAALLLFAAFLLFGGAFYSQLLAFCSGSVSPYAVLLEWIVLFACQMETLDYFFKGVLS